MVLKGEGLHLERRWKEASIEVVQQQRGPSWMSDRCQPRLGDTLTSEIIPDRLGFTNFGQEPTYLTNHKGCCGSDAVSPGQAFVSWGNTTRSYTSVSETVQPMRGTE